MGGNLLHQLQLLLHPDAGTRGGLFHDPGGRPADLQRTRQCLRAPPIPLGKHRADRNRERLGFCRLRERGDRRDHQCHHSTTGDRVERNNYSVNLKVNYYPLCRGTASLLRRAEDIRRSRDRAGEGVELFGRRNMVPGKSEPGPEHLPKRDPEEDRPPVRGRGHP